MKAVLPLLSRLALLVLVSALPLIALVVFNIAKHARLESEQASREALHSARALAEQTPTSRALSFCAVSRCPHSTVRHWNNRTGRSSVCCLANS